MNASEAQGRLPDFYGIGAPRCGTTTIYEVLRRQPGVFLPVKEPRYWCDDLDSGSIADALFFTRTFKAYSALYEPAAPGQTIGDMSTWYLFSERAIPRIVQAVPHARFVVGIRNPVDLMQSLHAWRTASVSEDILDFKLALAAEEDRLQGRRIPRNTRNRFGLLYHKVASQGEQLARLSRAVPRPQIHLYAYEDFRTDPRQAIDDILRFLDQPPVPSEQPIPVVNRRTSAGRFALRSFLLAPRAVKLAHQLVPRGIRRNVARLVDASTLRSGADELGLTELERSELLRSFRNDISLISEFTGRDMWALWSGET